jgi:hypothetical protein
MLAGVERLEQRRDARREGGVEVPAFFHLDDTQCTTPPGLLRALDLSLGFTCGLADEFGALASDEPESILEAVGRLGVDEARAIAAMDAFHRRARRVRGPACEGCGTYGVPLGQFEGEDAVLCKTCRDGHLTSILEEGLKAGLLETWVGRDGKRRYRSTKKGLRTPPPEAPYGARF